MKTAVEVKKQWTLKSGKKVTVSGKIIISKSRHSDLMGEYEAPTMERKVSIDVEGYGSFTTHPRELPEPNGEYTHYVRGEVDLILNSEQLDIIQSVKDELENSKTWQEHEERWGEEQDKIHEYEERISNCYSY